MNYKIAIIYGSVRSERLGIRVAKFIYEKCKAKGWEVELVDPKEYNLPLLDKMYKEYEAGKAPADMEKVAKILYRADGFMVVTGEYNHSLPPALTNLIDHFMPEFFYKPAGIVSYSVGGFGGIRAAVHARVLIGEVGAVTIPTMFPVSMINKTINEAGQAIDKKYDERVVKFIDEFEWYLKALREARDKGLPKQ